MLKRIYIKGLSIVNSGIGNLHLFLEKKGAVKPIPYTFYKNIENRVLVDHNYPLNYDQRDKNLFDHYTNYRTAGEQVIELHNVNITERGIVYKGFNNLGYALPHPVFRAAYGWLYILKQKIIKKKTLLPANKTYILAYDFWSAGNYYHWLVDTLPRIWIVKEELATDDFALLLPGNCPKFIKSILSYFEIKNKIYINKSEFVQVKKLLVPDYLAGSGHIHPQNIFEIKNYFLEKIKPVAGKKLVYVSRGRQKARLVVNEDEVIKHVLQMGFTIVYFEDHTFEEQVNIGRSAEVMITSHGANLTNSMFMRHGAKVLELIKDKNPNFCYWALCNAAKVDYYYQLCKVIGNDHLLVDLELFTLNLQKILNDQTTR